MRLDIKTFEDGDPAVGASGRAALAAWAERGRSAPLERWLDQLLDPDGVPWTLPVGDWAGLLALLDEAHGQRPGAWPERLDARIEGLVRATLRFARSSGAAVFAPPDARPDAALPALFRGWAERLADPGLGTVLDWWFPRRSGARSLSAPPLPAWSSPDRPLAMLRANWSSQGDFLALDQRARGETARVELAGLGRTWLGPSWTADHVSDGDAATAKARATRPRPTLWISNSSADLAEWTFRLGSTRVTRTALLLRGRRIALLADQVEGRAGQRAAFRIALPEGVAASPTAEGWGWALTTRRGRASARVIPLGLPRRTGPTDRGGLGLEEGQLCLAQQREGRRCWLPLLVSWDPLRNRRPVLGRLLTVAENSRTCPADVAFGARISWGRGETLLIYRSLGRPALRSVLGHQTRARFLVALFTRDGEVVPIVKID